MKKRIIIIFGIVFLVAIFLVTFFVFVKQENKKEARVQKKKSLPELLSEMEMLLQKLFKIPISAN